MMTMSILGLYEFDPTVFDNLELPVGVDKEIVVDNILMDLAELELLYPSADMMRFAIGAWSRKMSPIWVKLYETTQYEYNPIENYDRREEWNNTDTKDDTITSISRGSSESTNGGSDSTTDKVAAYNSSNMENRESSVTTYGGTNTSSNNNTMTNSVLGSLKVKRDGHIHGNIGVTTTQEMIESQRKVVEFNIVSRIVNDFKDRFCLLVY